MSTRRSSVHGRSPLERATRAAIAASFLLAAAPAGAQVIADSQADFSGVQGQDGWYYGYYESPLSPAGFQQFPLYNSFAPGLWSRTANAPGGYWTLVSNLGGHPSGTRGISGRQKIVNWAVRRYVFAAGGGITISGRLRKVVETCGNGVIGRIFINGTQAWSGAIAGNDTTGITYAIPAILPPGTVIDWAIDPSLGDEECDYSVFNAVLRIGLCAGDFNGDGLVDDTDFIQFASAYNILDCADPAMPAGCPIDLNSDGFVDDSDFVLFATAYNDLICP